MLREVNMCLCYNPGSFSLALSSSKLPDFPNQMVFITCEGITPINWQRKREIPKSPLPWSWSYDNMLHLLAGAMRRLLPGSATFPKAEHCTSMAGSWWVLALIPRFSRANLPLYDLRPGARPPLLPVEFPLDPYCPVWSAFYIRVSTARSKFPSSLSNCSES